LRAGIRGKRLKGFWVLILKRFGVLILGEWGWILPEYVMDRRGEGGRGGGGCVRRRRERGGEDEERVMMPKHCRMSGMW